MYSEQFESRSRLNFGGNFLMWIQRCSHSFSVVVDLRFLFSSDLVGFKRRRKIVMMEMCSYLGY